MAKMYGVRTPDGVTTELDKLPSVAIKAFFGSPQDSVLYTVDTEVQMQHVITWRKKHRKNEEYKPFLNEHLSKIKAYFTFKLSPL